jgi:hypothetical protein
VTDIVAALAAGETERCFHEGALLVEVTDAGVVLRDGASARLISTS